MPDKRIEFFTRRLKAVNMISRELDRGDPSTWDFGAVCSLFVTIVGYPGCWMCLVDDLGSVKTIASSFSNELSESGVTLNKDECGEYIKQCLLVAKDYIINKDPNLESIRRKSEQAEQINSLTIKLHHNNYIFGYISFIVPGNYKALKEERIILSELVRTISFFLYDIDYRSRIRDLFLTIFETTGNATTLIDEHTLITYANTEFEKLSGYTKAEIEGKKSFTDFVSGGDLEMMLKYHAIRRIDPVSAPRNYDFKFIDRYGEIKDIYMTIDMVPHTKLSIGSYMNVTEKKRLESEIIKISEIERLQVGNDLHDGLGPHLVGVKFMLKVLKNRVLGGEMPSAPEIDEIDNQLTSAINHTRILIKGLKPVDIQSDGLVFALEELTGRVSSIFGVDCAFAYDKGLSIDKNITATHLYYIARESINNAVKHGHVAKIAVSLKKTKSGLALTIEDDGIGIPKLLDNDRGMGINIMKYRASIINAGFKISKNSEGGTTIQCLLKT